MKKLFITAILFLSALGFSQNRELGKVTIDELKEKSCPTDTSAAAAYLFTVGKTFFEYSGDDGFQMVTEIFTKIKIYKKEAYDLANQSVRYYNGGNGKVKVDISKALTYNLISDKIEKSRLSSSGEFDEKVNKYYGRKKITMPNVKVGSIIEFKIEIRSPFISNFPEWEFQKFFPVNFSEYTTFIPEYFTYNVHLKGFHSPKTIKDSRQRKIEYTYHVNAMPGGVNGHGAETHKSELNFLENVTKYSLSDIPAIKDEAFVNNIDNYNASLLHELAGRRFQNGEFESFVTDWESVVKGIYNHDDFGNELNKTGYFEKDIDALLTGTSTNEEKITAIFNYVKSRMNWNDYYGFSCDDGVKKAYQDKKGNVAEINLMLTSMFRYAGFDANPVLVSTRSNGISLYPSKSAYNYVISGIELPGQIILLDATDKNALPNILPVRDLNWFGRIIRKNQSSAEVNLMPTSNSKEVINIMASINPQGEVSGKIRDQYFDYNAFSYRFRNNGIAKDSYIEKLEKNYQGLEIGDFDVLNSTDLSKPIIESYSFSTNNAVEIIGDKMYFSPFLYFAMSENPFKQEERLYPVDFIYPHQNKYSVSINIPEGYVVETIPQVKAIGMPEDLGNFKYSISNNGNQIQLLYTEDINQAIIGAEHYEMLKSFYKEMLSKQTEKIVLKKA